MNATARRPLIVAHRGASGYEPENTFASFDLAARQGADILELDVHLTKDDSVVVIHDDTLQRTTNGAGRIREKTFSEIRTLNAAAKEKNHQFESIPTLEQVLERYLDQVKLMVEIKHGSGIYKGIEQKVVSTIERFDAVDRCELISFDFDCIRKIRSIRMDVPTGIIFVGRIPEFTPLAKLIGCKAAHPSYEYVTAGDVMQAREVENLEIFSWTVNDVEEIRHQCNVIRPDGIVTDYPDVALQAVRRREFST